MTDINITDTDGKVLECLNSEDGTTVGDLLDAIGDGVLRAGGMLKASKTYVLEPGTYQWSSKRLKRTAYSVHVVVKGARNSAGARGNVFKKLQEHHAVYSISEGIDVKYEGDDLSVNAFFFEQSDAFDFQNALNDWEIHKELAHLSGVTIDPKIPVEVDIQGNVTRIMLQDYNPDDSESPCASLNDLHSYRLSVPLTEAVEPDTPLARYQCIDKQLPGLMSYKCHLKDKAKFKKLQNNENNMLAASWSFHQMMDGLRTNDRLPMVAISVKSRGSHRSAAHANRVAVTLLLEFREEAQASWFQGSQGATKIQGTNNWEVVAFVEDPQIFCDCVAWKHADTIQTWEAHQEFLDSM
eukprot:CAMPEP_0119014332 /NCGR_PEP_ID=MMETSP1176-20130426/9529_1 /TAXON_ID=265551 /ORGANISM="Synedropsis recta cf, Strain CCMP1620" /LENGTH=352 /DNA_ID=CAMNT_0006967487 /DNA_START=22 /DNA_END=1080 /DNA_ORIENTATION=-